MPTPEQIERATLALKVWPVFVEDPLLADAVAMAVLTAAEGRESASGASVRAEVADEIAAAIRGACDCGQSPDPSLLAQCEYRDAAEIALKFREVS